MNFVNSLLFVLRIFRLILFVSLFIMVLNWGHIVFCHCFLALFLVLISSSMSGFPYAWEFSPCTLWSAAALSVLVNVSAAFSMSIAFFRGILQFRFLLMYSAYAIQSVVAFVNFVFSSFVTFWSIV